MFSETSDQQPAATDLHDVAVLQKEVAKTGVLLTKAKAQHGPFIVWSPDGETPPKIAHKTHQAAHFAAQTMAKIHPGQTFMVMAKSGRSITAPAASAAA